jgi:hypothetical protein
MPELRKEPIIRELIDELVHDLEACQRELDKVIPLNITDDPFVGGYHLQQHPVEMVRHPAFLRGKITVLREVIQRLEEARTSEDVLAAYRDVVLPNLFGGEYCSTCGRVSVALGLRSRLDKLFEKLGIDPAPPTQTSALPGLGEPDR